MFHNLHFININQVITRQFQLCVWNPLVYIEVNNYEPFHFASGVCVCRVAICVTIILKNLKKIPQTVILIPVLAVHEFYAIIQ